MTPAIAAKYLSPQERKELSLKNDWKAAYIILHTWATIAITMGIVYFYPHPLVILVALFVLGGRQLACSIIMHDAGHYALFNNKKLNDVKKNNELILKLIDTELTRKKK